MDIENDNFIDPDDTNILMFSSDSERSESISLRLPEKVFSTTHLQELTPEKKLVTPHVEEIIVNSEDESGIDLGDEDSVRSEEHPNGHTLNDSDHDFIEDSPNGSVLITSNDEKLSHIEASFSDRSISSGSESESNLKRKKKKKSKHKKSNRREPSPRSQHGTTRSSRKYLMADDDDEIPLERIPKDDIRRENDPHLSAYRKALRESQQELERQASERRRSTQINGSFSSQRQQSQETRRSMSINRTPSPVPKTPSPRDSLVYLMMDERKLLPTPRNISQLPANRRFVGSKVNVSAEQQQESASHSENDIQSQYSGKSARYSSRSSVLGSRQHTPRDNVLPYAQHPPLNVEFEDEEPMMNQPRLSTHSQQENGGSSILPDKLALMNEIREEDRLMKEREERKKHRRSKKHKKRYDSSSSESEDETSSGSSSGSGSSEDSDSDGDDDRDEKEKRIRREKRERRAIRQRMKDQELKEKRELLYQFHLMEKDNLKPSKKFTLEDPLDEMRFEYHRLKNEGEVLDKIQFGWSVFYGVNNFVEMFFNRVKPLGVTLHGWSNILKEDKAKYERLFRKIYKNINLKYTMKPGSQLMMTFGWQAVSFILPKFLEKMQNKDNALSAANTAINNEINNKTNQEMRTQIMELQKEVTLLRKDNITANLMMKRNNDEFLETQKEFMNQMILMIKNLQTQNNVVVPNVTPPTQSHTQSTDVPNQGIPSMDKNNSTTSRDLNSSTLGQSVAASDDDDEIESSSDDSGNDTDYQAASDELFKQFAKEGDDIQTYNTRKHDDEEKVTELIQGLTPFMNMINRSKTPHPELNEYLYTDEPEDPNTTSQNQAPKKSTTSSRRSSRRSSKNENTWHVQ